MDPELEPLFPEALMRPTLAQAASWTTLDSIVTAARIVEGRSIPRANRLLFVFPDNELLQHVLLRVYVYLIESYRCSRQKLDLAAVLDPAIQPSTIDRLAASRLAPRIAAGRDAAARAAVPQLTAEGPFRIFEIVDEPPMLELAFEPFQMLHTTVLSLFAQAEELSALQRRASETSDEPVSLFFHSPHGDGPLFATLDALIYFSMGFRVGIEWGSKQQAVLSGFRCFDLVGEPPLRPVHFDTAKASFTALMEELARE